MRVTQGTFSFLPDLTDEEIEAQIKYSLRNGWAISVEYTDDPHPAERLLGDVGPAALRHEAGRRTNSRCARSRACREALPGALHQGDRLRPELRPADDRAELHRQPALGRAGLQPRPRADRHDRTNGYRQHSVRARTPPPGGATRPNGAEAVTIVAEHAFSVVPRAPGEPRTAARAAPEGEHGSQLDVDEAAEARRAIRKRSRAGPNVVAVLDQLDRELIGLAPVKTRIREIAALLVVDRLRGEVGLASERPSLHMSLHRQPGHRARRRWR